MPHPWCRSRVQTRVDRVNPPTPSTLNPMKLSRSNPVPKHAGHGIHGRSAGNEYARNLLLGTGVVGESRFLPQGSYSNYGNSKRPLKYKDGRIYYIVPGAANNPMSVLSIGIGAQCRH